MLVASIAEGAGMVWGRKWHIGLQGIKNFTVGDAIVWEVLEIVLMLTIITTCAYLIRLMGETFNSCYSYRQALTVVIYSSSPLFLLRLLNVIPQINFWIPWGIGVILSLNILYHGLPRILNPHPSHTLGLYFISSVFLTVLTGTERLIFIRCLNGQGVPVENLVFDITSKLPF
jgi:hypothetical protein